MTLASLIPLLAKVSIILFVFAIGLKASFSELTYLFRRPRLLARALASMYVLMPLFALGVAATFDLHPAVKIALVALSVSPIPPILPKKALKAGGQENYTIGLVVGTALLSVIIVPISMKAFEAITGVQLIMRPVAVAMLVMTSVLAPMVVGVVVRALFPAAEKAARPISVLASVLLLLAVLPILSVSFKAILSLVGDGTMFALGAFAICGLMVGHLLGPDRDDREVLALSTATRHPAVAIAIANTNFPGQKLVAPAVLLYLLISAFVSAPYLLWNKRSKATSTAHANEAKA